MNERATLSEEPNGGRILYIIRLKEDSAVFEKKVFAEYVKEIINQKLDKEQYMRERP